MAVAQKAADGPPELNSIDERIGVCSGSTVALKALHVRVGATSKTRTNNTYERIEDLTRENCRLRLEVQFYRDYFVHAQRFLSSIASVRARIERWSTDGWLSEREEQMLFKVNRELYTAMRTVELGMGKSQQAWEAFYVDRGHK